MQNAMHTGLPPREGGQTIKCLDTTFAIVTELTRRDGARVTELASATGLSKSSVHKHLTTLRMNDFVTKDDDVYRLGMRFLDVGGHVRNVIPGANIIRGVVRELADITEETAQFAIAEHGRAVIVFREAGRQGVYTRGRVGKRFYIHQTASGKAMLAQMSDEEVREIVDQQGLPKLTENTITDLDTLLDELAEIRERGYAINQNETTEGLRSVGVPIRGPDEEVLGATAVVGPSNRMRGDHLEYELPDLIRTAVNELELNLAYS
ncbi:IclR family transcriptional regulator [Salinigranum sp. GCM10025319]|uniref:IclR family transcriptional regulator n=1 Tax=Salinigranum sp. GCM10025319 TaxID=3252687 RepID=UPI0036213A2B